MRTSRLAQAIQPTLIRQVTDRARPDSLHLGLGQPDLEMPSAIADAIRGFADAGRAPYSPNLGTAACRRAVAEHYGTNFEQVMITCGVQEAMAVAIFGLVEPGDDVLVPDPGFPAYPNLVRAAGARPIPYALGENWSLDVERVDEAMTPETRAIILNTPSNPTGGVHTHGDLEKVLELVEARDVSWISDEIYEDFVYQSAHVSPWDFHGHRPHGVRLGGISKSHAAMGLRLGWLLAEADVVGRLKGLHQHLVTCAPTIAQAAAVEALAHHEAAMAEFFPVFKRRRQVMIDACQAIPQTSFVAPAGAFYLFLDVSAYTERFGSSVEMARRILDEENVVTIPGAGFGDGGEGHLRLAFTVDEPVIREACMRLHRFFTG